MRVPPILLLVLALPAAARAQETPPADFARLESERSRACVGGLARLADLEERMTPFALRAERLRLLGDAVALEDSTGVLPWVATDPIDEAVRQWFLADGELAQRIVSEGGAELQERRTSARTEIRARLLARMESLRAEAETALPDAADVETAALPCQDVVFVRPAVLEECRVTPSPLCAFAQPLAAGEPPGPVPFVETAEDVWGVEQLRPWTDPTPMQVGPDGGLTGAHALATARRGNLTLVVALGPLIRERSTLTPEQVQEYEANLDSLGFTFDHLSLVMAPVLEVRLNLPTPLGGETHYLLHFSEAGAGANVLASALAGGGSDLNLVLPVIAPVLARLLAGEPLSLTAVNAGTSSELEGEPVFTLPLTEVNQARAIGALISYLKDGKLAEDLALIVPPPGTPGTGG